MLRTFTAASPPRPRSLEAIVRALSQPIGGADGAFEDFLATKHKLRPQSKTNYRSNIRSFLRSVGETATLADFTKRAVDRHVSRLCDAGKQHMAANDAATLKAFSRWLADEGILEDDILTRLEIPEKPRSHRKELRDVELRRVLKVASESQEGPRDEAIVAVCVSAGGLRFNELRLLRLSDFDRATRTIFIRARTSKRWKDKRGHLGEWAYAALNRYLRDHRVVAPEFRGEDETLFTTRRGRPFSYQGFYKVFHRIDRRIKARGLEVGGNFYAHRLRRTMATNLDRAGVSVKTIQQLAGWDSSKMPELYTGDLTEEELAKVPDALDFAMRRLRPVG